MRIVIVSALVRSVDDNRGTDGRIERLTEPHADLVRGDGEHRIFSGVRPQQDGVRETDTRKEQRQADGKQGGGETHMERHTLNPIFSQTCSLLVGIYEQ